ncbi:hypothetical protein [Nocardia cyriacigeorgica]|uniref:hypothetical protein n=1 Tax=Nocardia cyriacigeorgica TaxID=135487 RepID=UPI00189518A1|nr:hypothetical protein [Nocardia cyriacigeorgica]MBF6436743.1 hypothetical protein [Nocardia cyriacigeorgica]MBF6452312.1 hypothetical protein [Nocardia cyriacigeorgica]MBF6481893.1 hypothetical protein [Nocardia cyriacigeorgica]MBF6549481.1 hypothetical protein [Nocardia cyriacigeorgica]
MTIIAIALIAIGLLVTIAIFIRKPAEHRRAHVTVAELQARLADESGPEHLRSDDASAAAEPSGIADDAGADAGPGHRRPGTGEGDRGDSGRQTSTDTDEPAPAVTGGTSPGDAEPFSEPSTQPSPAPPTADADGPAAESPADDDEPGAH